MKRQREDEALKIGLASYGLSRLPGLGVFLDGAEVAWLAPWGGRCDMVAGWGLKPSGLRARQRAARLGCPLLLLEDGFLRSVERSDPPLSVVVDDLGAHYDAGGASRLEQMVASPLDAGETARARALMAAWRQARVSKYNHAREYAGPLPERYVLVVDQTFNDASIRHGGANEASFARMLEAALAENGDCTVVVKTHPDVFTRGRRGYYDPARLKTMERVMVVAQDCHPARLLENARAVYAVTSQMGFEALMWGVRVRTFGMPFYAGWGLTADELAAPSRRGPVPLEQLAHGALIAYPRYVDPETGERCEAERAIEHVGLQRAMRARFAEDVHAVGFSRWKRPILARFLAGSRLRFAATFEAVPRDAAVAVWGSRPAAAGEHRLIRVEDGFLRSVGLGADFTQPLSWVQDETGIYYDASRPSALEEILARTAFTPQLVARAARLRQAITAAGITKYNVGSGGWSRPKTDKKVILVPGQVESDASIRLGTRNTCTNAELMRAARALEPGAFLVYKPHPDVMAGVRAGRAREEEAFALADETVTGTGIAAMLGQVDAVHTMTSLVGFEALMRGVAVTCHGLPFYAGWGLTRDVVAPERRGRKLALDELVAGALILYPAYVSRVSGRFTTPERALAELIAWRERDAAARGTTGRERAGARRIASRLVSFLRGENGPR